MCCVTASHAQHPGFNSCRLHKCWVCMGYLVLGRLVMGCFVCEAHNHSWSEWTKHSRSLALRVQIQNQAAVWCWLKLSDYRWVYTTNSRCLVLSVHKFSVSSAECTKHRRCLVLSVHTILWFLVLGSWFWARTIPCTVPKSNLNLLKKPSLLWSWFQRMQRRRYCYI